MQYFIPNNRVFFYRINRVIFDFWKLSFSRLANIRLYNFLSLQTYKVLLSLLGCPIKAALKTQSKSFGRKFSGYYFTIENNSYIFIKIPARRLTSTWQSLNNFMELPCSSFLMKKYSSFFFFFPKYHSADIGRIFSCRMDMNFFWIDIPNALQGFERPVL